MEDGEYVFDNLPTAVVKYNTATGTDEYFLAAYRVELAATKHYLKDGYEKDVQDPWHLTSVNEGTTDADLAIDSNAHAERTGDFAAANEAIAGNADELAITDADVKALYHSYPVVNRYATDGSVRANDGQVILAQVAGTDAKGLAASFSDIPVANAMDTAAGATYQWTHPLVTEVAGDVGEVAPAYRAIGGYVWKDNAYKDGIYNTRPGEYENLLGSHLDPTKLEAAEEGRVGTRIFVRQWYYDPDRLNTASAFGGAPGCHWFPVPPKGLTQYGDDRDDYDTFAYDIVRTQSAAVSGKPADGYYEFSELPVRVFVNGKEFLAGYTVAIYGNPDYKPQTKEQTTSPYLTEHTDIVPDEWNSKGGDNVRPGGQRAYHYGVDVFPVRRTTEYSDDGNIHVLDSIMVLAGSTKKDANGTRTSGTQYKASSADKVYPEHNPDQLNFDLTFGKSETRMNGGYIVPPSAPIEGWIWEDANYDGVRQVEVKDENDKVIQKGERGIGGVKLRITQYYLDDKDTTGGPEGTWKRTYELKTTTNVDGTQTPVLGPDGMPIRVLKAPYPATSSYGDDPHDNLELGQYRSVDVPTSFKKPDATELGEESDREYLAGYTVGIVNTAVGDPTTIVPNTPLAGYTLTRSHVGAAMDQTAYNTESDVFRYATKSGLGAEDCTMEALALANRFIDKQDPAAAGDPRVPVERVDGMVIVANECIEETAENIQTRKKYNGVTYDTNIEVSPSQQGGNAGFVKIPETTIEGIVWDDSYSDQWADTNPLLDRAERDRSYDGIYDEKNEAGLPGRTVALTQWKYVPGADGAAGTWERVQAFDGDVTGW